MHATRIAAILLAIALILVGIDTIALTHRVDRMEHLVRESTPGLISRTILREPATPSLLPFCIAKSEHFDQGIHPIVEAPDGLMYLKIPMGEFWQAADKIYVQCYNVK